MSPGADGQARYRRQQRLSVVGTRTGQHFLDRALFHEYSVLHDYDALAHQAHDLNVVADEQVGETEISPKSVKEAKATVDAKHHLIVAHEFRA